MTDVLIFGLVAPGSRRRLTAALPELVVLDSWASLIDQLPCSAPAVVVLDTWFSDAMALQLHAIRRLDPTVEFILYSVMEPEQIRRCVDAAQAGITEIAFVGYDDSRERLKAIIEQAVLKSCGSTAGQAFDGVIRELPAPLREAAGLLFRDPAAFQTTQDLARAAGMSIRSVFRNLRSSGIRSGRRLIAAARVMTAFHMLNQSRRSANDVAHRVGYASVDQLSAHLAELAGCTSRDLRRGMSEAAFREAVISALLSNSGHESRKAGMA